MTRRTAAGLLAAVTAVVGAAACGSSANSKAVDATATAPAVSTTTAPARNAVTITATDYKFAVSGPVHPGMVDVVLDNRGSAYHMVEMAPLKDGVTSAQIGDAASKGEDALFGLVAGDPGNVAVTGLPATIAPGRKAEAMVHFARAAKYLMMCFVPGPQGQPHVALGMLGTLDVSGTTAGNPPAVDGTITLTDSAIEMPDAAGSGTGWYAVRNSGTAPHAISIAALPSGTTLDAEYQWFGEHFAQNQPLRGAPGDLVTGLNVVTPGETAYLRLDLPSGHYGYVSTEGDPPADDYSKGLKGEFDVR